MKLANAQKIIATLGHDLFAQILLSNQIQISQEDHYNKIHSIMLNKYSTIVEQSNEYGETQNEQLLNSVQNLFPELKNKYISKINKNIPSAQHVDSTAIINKICFQECIHLIEELDCISHKTLIKILNQMQKDNNKTVFDCFKNIISENKSAAYLYEKDIVIILAKVKFLEILYKSSLPKINLE